MTLIPGTVTHVADRWANVRQFASTSAPDIGDLRVGDTVQYDPTPVTGGWYFVNGVRFNTWLPLAQGFVAEQVIRIAPQSVPEPPALSLLGIDVSDAGQAYVRWRDVKAQGFSFALIRATQGIATSRPVGRDTKFVPFIDGALAEGLRVGVYHAYLPYADGAAQAKFYYEAIAPYLDRLAFPPALDVEITNEQSAATITERLYALATTLEALIGMKPMVYTNVGFFDEHTTTSRDPYFAQCPLWAAHWTKAEKPLLPRPWRNAKRTWDVWQYSSSSKVAGVGSDRCDLNRVPPPP